VTGDSGCLARALWRVAPKRRGTGGIKGRVARTDDRQAFRKLYHKMKILVVEDEKGMAQLLRRGLEEESHVVSLADDGIAALSLAQNAQFDLVLLDVMLPGMNGIQIARRLRETRANVPTLRDATAFGVLKLTLKPNSYEWQFIPQAGKSFTDSGSSNCHGRL